MKRAVVLAVAVVGTLTATAPAATRSADDWIELRAADVAADPQAKAQQLTDAGVNAQVYVVPATADAVGRFVIAEVAGGKHECQGEETVRLGTIQHSDDMTTLRLSPSLLRESDGRFVFYVGRPAGAEHAVIGGSPGLAREAPGLPALQERIARARDCDTPRAARKARRGHRPSRRARSGARR